MYELMVEESFSAAHQLLKSNSPCENLHGHNWKVQLFISAQQLDTQVGWVMDFKIIKQKLREELAKYDHQILNQVMACSPTAENIARIIFENIAKELPVTKVTVWETEKASASYLR